MKTLKNKKILSSVFAILVCLALITGATMAWFTVGGVADPNDYEAGRLGFALGLDNVDAIYDADYFATNPYDGYTIEIPDWQPGDVIGSSAVNWAYDGSLGDSRYIGTGDQYQWLIERWVRFIRTLNDLDPFVDATILDDFNVDTGDEVLTNLLFGVVTDDGEVWEAYWDNDFADLRNAELDDQGYLQNELLNFGVLKNTGNLSLALRLATGSGVSITRVQDIDRNPLVAPVAPDPSEYPLEELDPDYIADLAAYDAAALDYDAAAAGDAALFPFTFAIPQTYNNALAITNGDVTVFTDDTTGDYYFVLAPGAYLDLSLLIDCYTYAGSEASTGNPIYDAEDPDTYINNSYEQAIITVDLAPLGTQGDKSAAWLDIFGLVRTNLTYVSQFDLWGTTDVLV
jgi:hypothetical protein